VSAGNRIKCPEDDTGRNSVMPWISAASTSVRSGIRVL
jgi:hypothetical protein